LIGIARQRIKCTSFLQNYLLHINLMKWIDQRILFEMLVKARSFLLEV